VAKKTQAKNVSPQQLSEIWNKISPADWLALLEEHKPGHQWTLRGDSIVGCCIYHQEDSPSFYVNPKRGNAHCFGGSCPKKNVWNPVAFVADVMGISYVQALRTLKNRFGIALPAAYAQNAQQIEDNDKLKRLIAVVMNREFREAVENPDDPNYSYIEESGLIDWFRKRKFPEDVLHRLPIGVMPTYPRLSERLKEIKGGVESRDAAHTYLQEYFAPPGSPPKSEGALVFFYYTSPTTIGRFRIRQPGTSTQYAVDDPYSEDVGYFGLNLYPEHMGDLDNYPLHVVEGEFDALAIIAHQLSGGFNDVCIVATGGSMEANLDVLGGFGFTKMRLLPDNDSGGVGWAKNLMTENELVSSVFSWTDEERGHVKDVDEAVRAYGFEPFYDRVQNKKSYVHNHTWAITQTAQAFETIDEGDVDARNAVVVEFGSALKKDAERDAFLKHVCDEYSISREWVLQGIVPFDTPEGFTQRLHRLLEETYQFLHNATTQQGVRMIKAWSKKRKIVVSFPMDSVTKIHAQLAGDLGDLEQYVAQNLGMPDFLRLRDGPRGRMVARSLSDTLRQLDVHFQKALERAGKIIAEVGNLDEIGQGVHFIRDPEDGTATVYVVNGRTNFFKGTLTDDTITYERLECPVDGEHMFRATDKPWSVNLNSLEDIAESEQHDPKDAYHMVRGIIDRGWKFMHHDLETTFIAADILYTPVSLVFETTVVTDLNGETQSGKTTLFQIYGGDRYPGYRLCEAVTAIQDDYTKAAILFKNAGNSLRVMMDEFEENDMGASRPTKRGNAVRDIRELIRGLAMGKVESIRGTAGGQHISRTLRCPVTIGGIYTMDEPRDLNRYVHIRTKFIRGFPHPIFSIQQRYTVEDMRKLRRAITLCWLGRIPQLRTKFEETRQTFAGGANLPSGMYTRLLDNLLPAATILNFIGEDYIKFVQEFSILKMQEMADQGATVQESEEIWEEVLHTGIPLAHHSRDAEGVSSVSYLLSHGTAHILSQTDLGVYYVPERKWLVVFWPRALSTLLTRSPKFRNYTGRHGRIKMIADNDPRVVPQSTLKREGFIRNFVRPRIGARIALSNISVIDLTDTVDFTQKNDEPAHVNAERQESVVQDLATEVGAGKPDSGNFDV